MAAAIAHSISSVAPEKAMDYDMVFAEHMAEISVLVNEIGNAVKRKGENQNESYYPFR